MNAISQNGHRDEPDPEPAGEIGSGSCSGSSYDIEGDVGNDMRDKNIEEERDWISSSRVYVGP